MGVYFVRLSSLEMIEVLIIDAISPLKLVAQPRKSFELRIWMMLMLIIEGWELQSALRFYL